MRTIDLRGRTLSTAELLAAVPRATAARASAVATASEIVEDVRIRGEESLREQAERFDGVTGHALRVPQAHIDEAVAGLDPAVRQALDEAIRRVRVASAAQVPAASTTQLAPGARVTQRWQPVSRVGVYVPGGKAVYPSSVVMNVVPAQVAGVRERRARLARPERRTAGACTRRSSPRPGCWAWTRCTRWAAPGRSAPSRTGWRPSGSSRWMS